jgi:hypothetical protein
MTEPDETGPQAHMLASVGMEDSDGSAVDEGNWTPEAPVYSYEPLDSGSDASGYGGYSPHPMLVSELLERSGFVQKRHPPEGST